MTLRAIALLGALALAPAPAAGAGAPSFLCAPAKARIAGGSGSPVEVVLTDRLATPREATVGTVRSACWAEAPAAERLAGLAARVRSRKARRVGAGAALVTRFGVERVVVKAFTGVALGATGSDPSGAPRACYAVRGRRPGEGRARVLLTDAAGERVFDVGRPTRLCLPTGGDAGPELLCHAARLARTKPLSQGRPRPFTMTLATALGTVEVRVGAPRELCVPARELEAEPPGFALAVTPSALTVLAGERPPLEAVARFADGHEEPFTHRVRFASSDETVVRGTSVAGAYVEAVGPGAAVVSAMDLVTGARSRPAGDATLTVEWPLEKLVLSPHATTKQPGAHLGYTVKGFFTNGVERNLTQRVVYASSDETVATAPNTPGNRSRVFALAPGTAVVSARDPISGITTTDSGNDATLRVAPRLTGIGVATGLKFSSLFPGQSRRLTATGHYEDGSTKNLTQACDWWSTEPGVAAVANEDGDRSRLDALAPGFTFVGCTDSATGLKSWHTPFWVLGDLLGLEVYGGVNPSDWLREGKSLRPTAVGRYEHGGYHNLTQDVVWSSLDPDVAVATNPPGDRSRVDAVGPGWATIEATDTETGIAGTTRVRSMGALVGVEVRTRPGTLFPGTLRLIAVRGLFEFGEVNLSYVQRGFTLLSSDPAVLEVVDEVYVRGVAAGVAEITARDDATGITSAPVAMTVRGNLESITLTPATVVRGIGEWETFTATGYFPPLHQNVTQGLYYASSDPSVAVADNTPGNRSRVRTVGAGTAVVTATDLFSGLTATATVTVLPGTIERITIEPASVVRNPGNAFSFTAIGHYPGGATVNVTQIVTWASLAPDVAAAENPAGDRSRVVAKTPGTALVTASHPSGVSSQATGDDATFTTKPLVGLALDPAAITLPVGRIERYTLVGTFDDASTINLTQQAYYWTDDPAVAVAEGEEGDRSAVRLVAPGTTMVRASFADWSTGGPVLSGSVAGAFLGVVP